MKKTMMEWDWMLVTVHAVVYVPIVYPSVFPVTVTLRLVCEMEAVLQLCI